MRQDNRLCLKRSWTGDAICRQDADQRSLGAGSKRRRGRCRRRALSAAFSSLSPAAPPRTSPVQSGLALFERDCGVRVCDPRDRHSLEMQPLRTSQLRGAPHVAAVLAGTGTSENFLLAASRKLARHFIGVRDDEIDHCPHQPLSPTRGNFLDSRTGSLAEETQASNATSCRSG